MSETKIKMRTKAKISFIEFLRPDSFWPYPYTIEQVFHVLQWMVKEARYYIHGRQYEPIALLSCKPSCIFVSGIEPIVSVDDLRMRFHYALLGRVYGNIAAWREDNGITIDGSRILHFPHHGPGGLFKTDARTVLDKLFHDGERADLAVSLNCSHLSAKQCQKILIYVLDGGFLFVLKYGFDKSFAASSWAHELARTEGNEPFYATMRRAVDTFYGLTKLKGAP